MNTPTAFTTRAAVTQHWAGKAPSLSKGKWLKRALGAAQKRYRSKLYDTKPRIAVDMTTLLAGNAFAEVHEVQMLNRAADARRAFEPAFLQIAVATPSNS